MYLFAILGVILSGVFLTFLSSNGFSSLTYYWDIVSLVIIFIITVPILFASGLHKDFNHAFSFTIGKKKPRSLIEIKRAKSSIALVGRTLIGAGTFCTIGSSIIVFMEQTDVLTIFRNCAVTSLTLLYALALNFLLLPIYYMLDTEISEYMHNEEEL